MRMIDEPQLKPVIWVGSSRKDIRAFPEPVQDHMGYARTSRSAAASIATRKRLAAWEGQGSWR